jgi:hypothetical protein
MKREIKFRVWNNRDKKMLNVAGAEFISGREIMSAGTLLPDEVVYGKNNGEYFSPMMQYTGLFDKNGREIYEGDILDIGLRDQDGKPVVAPVSYEAYLAGYVLDNRGYGIWQRLGGDCEVVGNIFENPELLEDEE